MSDQSVNPNFVVPEVAPVIRVPADDNSIQETNAALANLVALMGNPAQDGSLSNILQQLALFGAQPWVPNIQSAALNLQAPGFYTMATPSQAFRIWGGFVTGSARASSGYGPGTDAIYMKVYTSNTPQLTVAIVELALAVASSADSGSTFMQIPGVPMPAGTPMKLDVNGNVAISGAVLRGSGAIFYSIP
jgi:hypothetical protein